MAKEPAAEPLGSLRCDDNLIAPLDARALLTWRGAGSTKAAMDIDDLFPSRPEDPLAQLGRQDLDPLSAHELDERIAALEAEIARVKAHQARVADHRNAAEDLFRKPD